MWLAILGHAVVFIALALLATWRGEGWWGTVVVTVISVGLSGWEIRLFGRPKGVSASVWGSWLLALPTVWLGLQTGFI